MGNRFTNRLIPTQTGDKVRRQSARKFLSTVPQLRAGFLRCHHLSSRQLAIELCLAQHRLPSPDFVDGTHSLLLKPTKHLSVAKVMQGELDKILMYWKISLRMQRLSKKTQNLRNCSGRNQNLNSTIFEDSQLPDVFHISIPRDSYRFYGLKRRLLNITSKYF